MRCHLRVLVIFSLVASAFLVRPPDASATGTACSGAPAQGCVAPTPIPEQKKSALCKDQCGDGVCQEMVCMSEGCPCAESQTSCPADCSPPPGNHGDPR